MEILKKEYQDVEISFDELFTKLNFNNYNLADSKNIEDLDILIESYDINKKEVVFKPLTHLIIKNEVQYHYELISENKQILKTTASHRTLQNNEWISSENFSEANLVLSPMKVVDVSVKDTECYIANGQINHNTTPGGKAIRFFASIRIKLQGKSPIVMLDPAAEALYNKAVEKYEVDLESWKNNGKNGNKPEKPKKGDFKGDQVLIGYDVTAKTDKNKLAPPIREAEFRILFAEGIVDGYSWLDYAVKSGLIKNNKNDFEFINDEFKIGVFKRNEWLDILSDEAIYKKVKNTLDEILVRPTNLEDLTLSNLSKIDEELTEESFE